MKLDLHNSLKHSGGEEGYVRSPALMLRNEVYGNWIHFDSENTLCCFQAICKKIGLSPVLNPSSNTSEIRKQILFV